MSVNSVSVRPVETQDEWEHVLKIRHQVFMIDDNEPPEEQFDGNDHCSAIHILVRKSGIPIGCMRLRIISMADGGTMIWERMAILKEYKGSLRTLNIIADTAMSITRAKGCRRVVGIVNDERLINFWERKGFKKTGEPPEVFRGKKYFPMHQVLDVPLPDPVRLHWALMSEPSLLMPLSS